MTFIPASALRRYLQKVQESLENWAISKQGDEEEVLKNTLKREKISENSPIATPDQALRRPNETAAALRHR